jgi:hypothetical protein
MERTTTSDGTIGVSIVHPARWAVGPERHTYADTYGFTLWKPNPSRVRYHGGSPVVRVALAYSLRPDQIESKVQEKLDAVAHSALPMTSQEVSVGEGNLKGRAVGPIPGSTPSTEVYVAVDDERVYQINVYGRTLDAEGRELLSSLRFEPPSEPVESLGLLDAAAPEAFTVRDERHLAGQPPALQRFVATELERFVERERSAFEAGRSARSAEAALDLAEVADLPEFELEEGCFRAPSSLFVQTQHGMFANARFGPEFTGFTVIGRPNFWGEFTHGGLTHLGFGRCVEPCVTNDFFAIDYPLDFGDVVFCPFANGTVTFAGRNFSHADYGVFVIIQDDSGLYVGLSGHLTAVNVEVGQAVTDQDIIGFAGATGGGNIPVDEPHLHQAFYRDPSFTFDGAPFGGQGLQVIFHHFVGTAAGSGPGVAQFGFTSDPPEILSKGDFISN